jgi:hypothetical protein
MASAILLDGSGKRNIAMTSTQTDLLTLSLFTVGCSSSKASVLSSSGWRRSSSSQVSRPASHVSDIRIAEFERSLRLPGYNPMADNRREEDRGWTTLSSCGRGQAQRRMESIQEIDRNSQTVVVRVRLHGVSQGTIGHDVV